jgi:hypothetical protein
LEHYKGCSLLTESDSLSCGSRPHEQGGTQADLRQPLDRKSEMYYSVRFLDNIGNIELKSISCNMVRVKCNACVAFAIAAFSYRDSCSLAFLFGGES